MYINIAKLFQYEIQDGRHLENQFLLLILNQKAN